MSLPVNLTGLAKSAQLSTLIFKRSGHVGAAITPARYRERLGTREIVGYGINGKPYYYDKPEFPFPAIRFREATPEIDVSGKNQTNFLVQLSN